MLIRLVICLLFPLPLIAQNITGNWKGYLTSEEGTVQYELSIIAGQDGNYSGYALTRFVFAGTENVGIKKITIRKKKEDFFLEDGELVYDNYATKPRRVILSGRLHYQQAGTHEVLTGDFSTRSLDMRARDQNNLKGDVNLQRATESENLVILDKLASLNLIASANTKQLPVTEIKNTVTTVTGETTNPPEILIAYLPPPDMKPAQLQLIPVKKNDIVYGQIVAHKVNIKVQPLYYASSQPVTAAINRPATETVTKATASVNDPVQTNLNKTPPSVPAPGTPVPGNVYTQVQVDKRATEIIRSVNFAADSLVIRLYDNGEIDGDTVSVLLNGRVIIARKGLTATPITHTIYITPDLGDSLQLTMYAENLGSIPPNTGLLIIQDGEQRHSINFSGDYQKNSAIILRRKD